MPSFYTACGPEQGVGSGPDLGQNSNQCCPDWASSGLFYLFIFMADIWPSYGLLVAQILQTGVDHPNAIILHSMWAGARCWIWARIQINVARIWASPALFGLFMADIGPSFGLLVAQIWQTGVDCPSAIIPESVRCGPDLGLRSFAIWVLCVMLITLCLFFLKLYMSLDLSYLAYYLINTGSINCN